MLGTVRSCHSKAETDAYCAVSLATKGLRCTSYQMLLGAAPASRTLWREVSLHWGFWVLLACS